MLRYQVDLELLAYSESVQNDVREALKILRNASLPRPENLSAYLTETELAEFETETADMRSRSRQRLEFWTKERTKWQKAWDSGSTDYVPPPHQPDVFRFNYDDGRKLRTTLTDENITCLAFTKKIRHPQQTEPSFFFPKFPSGPLGRFNSKLFTVFHPL